MNQFTIDCITLMMQVAHIKAMTEERKDPVLIAEMVSLVNLEWRGLILFLSRMYNDPGKEYNGSV